jgi:DNA-binding response OmpR family regulator
MVPARPVLLVVEDDPTICELLQDVLEPEGYGVECAVDGATAVAHLEANQVDLVLLDLKLPDLDGVDFCRWARAHADAKYVPIIITSAAAEEPHRQASFAAGADDYLPKPFSIEDLLDRVHRQLDRRPIPMP